MSRRYPARPIVGVGALVIQGDKVLLVQRSQNPFNGQWSLPGGAVEAGETLATAIRREVFEETGLETEVGPSIAVIDSIHSDGHGRVEYHYILIDYRCKFLSGDVRAGSDASAAGWFARAEVENLSMQPATRRMILSHLQ